MMATDPGGVGHADRIPEAVQRRMFLEFHRVGVAMRGVLRLVARPLSDTERSTPRGNTLSLRFGPNDEAIIQLPERPRKRVRWSFTRMRV